MPFWYHLPVPKLGEKSEPQSVRIVRWLVAEGAELHRGTKVAVIEAPSGLYEVLANGDGFFRERLFPEGATLPASSPMGTINADGENIPYDRPYSTARRVNRGSGRIETISVRVLRSLSKLRLWVRQ